MAKANQPPQAAPVTTQGDSAAEPRIVMCEFHPTVPAVAGKMWCEACWREYEAHLPHMRPQGVPKA